MACNRPGGFDQPRLDVESRRASAGLITLRISGRLLSPVRVEESLRASM